VRKAYLGAKRVRDTSELKCLGRWLFGKDVQYVRSPVTVIQSKPRTCFSGENWHMYYTCKYKYISVISVNMIFPE
jgi:hypothetical protein